MRESTTWSPRVSHSAVHTLTRPPEWRNVPMTRCPDFLRPVRSSAVNRFFASFAAFFAFFCVQELFWRFRPSLRATPFAIYNLQSGFRIYSNQRRHTLLDFLGDLRRTHMCGALRPADAGKKAVLMGWVNRRRDLGAIIFVDVRDRSGVTQVVFSGERNAAVHERAELLRNEYVVAVIGTVKLRDADTVNKNIPTGEVELVADELRILNEAKHPPFLPSDTGLANEETRLKYRYIEMRRDVSLAIRDYLASKGFFEIETPFMTRSTPEGARDYLVPSRVQPGMFYALPQSPQIFKQILMISGFDKYFQIVRCFRDEDLRADRQPEFTQIDLEMSYPQPERVWETV